MPRLILFLAPAVMLTLSAPYAFASSEWEANIHFLSGKRTMGKWDSKKFESDQSELKTQNVLGAEIDFGKELWPVNIWIGYSQSEKSLSIPEIDFVSTAKFTEVSLGVRAYLLWFFAGGAIANVGGKLTGELAGVEQNISIERETGLLLNAGVQGSLIMLNIGLDVRALTGTQNNDYAQIAVKAGINF